MLLLAELFLAMSIYVQIPVLRSLFSDTGISSGWETYGLLSFAVGLYLLGGFIEPFSRSISAIVFASSPFHDHSDFGWSLFYA